MTGAEHVVFVCTGNLCRSPMAEALMRRRLSERGAASTLVSSAGTRAAWSGATRHAVEVVRGMGCDLEGHRAQRTEAVVVESADLVVAMTADHVIDLLHEAPGAAPVVFKLSELARRAEEEPPRRPDEPLRAYAHRLSSPRGERPWVDSRDDPDVTDPMGETVTFYRRIADEIDGYLVRIVPRVWPR